MYLLLIMALISALWLSFTDGLPSLRSENLTTSSSIEVDQYRIFMHASSSYIDSITTTVSVPTSVYWPEIKAASGVAPAVAAMTMPLNWKIVRLPNGEWVGCTEMDSASITALPSLIAAGGLIDSGEVNKPSGLMNQSSANLPLTAIVNETSTMTLATLGGGQPTHFVVGDTPTAVVAAAACL
jgi:hypothetical protein